MGTEQLSTEEIRETEVTKGVVRMERPIEPLQGFTRDLSGSAEDSTNAIRQAQERGFTIGTAVRRIGDSEVGKVTGYNESRDGVYPGSRYPIMVQFTDGEFPFSENGIEIVK